LDNNPELAKFATDLETVCIKTVEDGFMTKDLALSIHGKKLAREHYLESFAYLDKVNEYLQKARA